VLDDGDVDGYAAFEHAWALILAVAKQIPDEDRTMSV
jgi:phosphoglycerate dehydrogenase-like enzyme